MDAAVAAAVDPTDMVSVVQGANIALAPLSVLLAAPLTRVGATETALVAVLQRLAALEGKPDPCVALSGTLPVATLQIGTSAVSVPVAGLLATDRVSVQPASDLPAGLVLAWAHPKADGVLTVALDALAVLAVKAPIPLLVTALR